MRGDLALRRGSKRSRGEAHDAQPAPVISTSERQANAGLNADSQLPGSIVAA
jgi:hypothetical protein